MNNTPTVTEFSVQLAEFEKIYDVCKKLMATKHYSNLGEAGVHSIMAKAKALGIHPFEALNGGFHCINGKVGMSTELMAALVRQRGHSIVKDPKSNNECVILHGKRKDSGDEWTCTFTKEDAERAGLWNSATWKKYPGIMLYNRCMSMLFRQLFPDLSLGAGYVEDELREITANTPVEKLPVAEAEEIPKASEPPPVVYITSEQTKELEELLSKCEDDFAKNVHSVLDKRGLTLSTIGKVMYDNVKAYATDHIKALQGAKK